MLQNIKQLYGKTVSATDGEIGEVRDFYFDDSSWGVRYVVVETGSWLSGRLVLLARHAFENNAFGRSNPETAILRVALTRQQIEDSPPLEAHRPVSRPYEEEYHRYFCWPTYWQDAGVGGAVGFLAAEPPQEYLRRYGSDPLDNVCLRSTTAVTDYHIQAIDGPIGSVSSFVVDGKTWAIRELEVETGRRHFTKKILLHPENIERINHGESKVFVNLSKEDIQLTLNDEVAKVGAGYR